MALAERSPDFALSRFIIQSGIYLAGFGAHFIAIIYIVRAMSNTHSLFEFIMAIYSCHYCRAPPHRISVCICHA